VVIVSGRSIAGVRHVARVAPDAILGDHGARVWHGGTPKPWLKADRATLVRSVQRVAPELARHRGVRLEQKDRSLAIHLRLTRGSREAVIAEITGLLKRAGLRVLRGHRVIDAQLPGVNKGRAVERWLNAEGNADAVMYAGDDTTDLDAFRALKGRAMTIAVGPRVRGAGFRTRDPKTFAAWLGRLAEARSDRSLSAG
jgi:trehalose-phosphatase